MKVHIAQIPEEGLPLTGELPPEVLSGLEFVPTGPIRYDVEASLQGEALLVLGRLEVTGTTPCTRCLTTLPLTAVVPEFVVYVEKPEGECVDLTESVREDILLVLPTHAKCTLDAERRCPVTGEVWQAFDPDVSKKPLGDPWRALDSLKDKIN